MENFIIQYWYLLIFLFIMGIILCSFNQNYFKRLFSKFLNKAPLIRKYWIFVVLFSIIVFVLCYLIIKNLEKNDQRLYLPLVVQSATLIFAVYAGYLAFKQLMENRRDKLREDGDRYLTRKQYKRATECYLEVSKIKPNDYESLSNILEVYLLNRNLIKFVEGLPILNKLAIEDGEKLVCSYLAAANYLLEMYNSRAREEIDDIMTLNKKNPQALEYINWNFEDIKKSSVYENLEGESKKILENLVRYLSKGMNAEQIKKFEGGDYLLEK